MKQVGRDTAVSSPIFAVLAAKGIALLTLILTLACSSHARAEAQGEGQSPKSPNNIKNTKGLLMKQFSARYGSVTTMVTDKNFRMDAAEIRVFIKPPFKTVAVYNTSSKTVYHSDIAALGKDIDWHDFKPDEIKAHGAERTVAKNDDHLQEYAMKRYLIEHYYPSRPTLPSLEFWTTRDKDFPHELDRACCLLSGLPVGYGFPLKVYQYRSRTKRDGTPYFAHYRVLDTSKIIPQDFPDTTFAEPAGCKPVKDLMELMVGDGGN